MPVNKNIRSLKGRSVPIKSVAVFKIAFDLEIELLGKIAGQVDACPAQAESILQRRLAKASLECGNIAVFKIHLDESTQNQLQFRSALLHINRWLLFYDGLFNVCFSVVSDLCLHFAFRDGRTLLLQRIDLSFELGNLTLELLYSCGFGGWLSPKSLCR